MMKRKRVQVPRGGFTLIEAAVATVIVGIGVGVLLTAVQACTRTNSAGRDLTQGVFLAQQIREWTLRLPFSDPDPGDQGNPPGSDGMSPQNFVDDLDDLMDVTYSPPRDEQLNQISDMSEWSEKITLTWRNPNNLTEVVASGSSDVIYVQLDLFNSDQSVMTTGWLVTRKE